jgi:hypothetical protein
MMVVTLRRPIEMLPNSAVEAESSRDPQSPRGPSLRTGLVGHHIRLFGMTLLLTALAAGVRS